MLGMAVLSPGAITRTESLRRVGKEAAAVCFGVACMLLVAATAESFVRQSKMSNEVRFAFAAASGLFWSIYFFYGWLRERDANRHSLARELDLP